MITGTSTATYRNLVKKLTALETKLSPQERANLRALLPKQIFTPHGAGMEFLFAAPEDILTPNELEIFSRLRDGDDVDLVSPCALRSSMVVIMKATRLCNLRCTYCHSWKEGPNQVMGFAVLAKVTHDALRRPEVKHVDFCWHGGEVTLLPISFFKKAVWLQQRFRREGQTITNSIQTNATRLDEEWIDLFLSAEFNVGVSIDGPREIHDRRRRTAGGQATWELVKEGIARLQREHVPFGALVVVDRQVVELGAEHLLSCLLELKVPGASLLNVLPQNGEEEPTDESYLPWPEYVSFLKEIFRLWWPRYRDKINIRELNDLISNLAGNASNLCVFAGDCMGKFLTIEPNGTVSACDKYIGDRQFEFGNILTTDLNTALARSKNLARARESTAAEASRMTKCNYYAVCRGGCPHDRRLNQLYQRGWVGDCCGLRDLLDEINATLHN